MLIRSVRAEAEAIVRAKAKVRAIVRARGDADAELEDDENIEAIARAILSRHARESRFSVKANLEIVVEMLIDGIGVVAKKVTPDKGNVQRPPGSLMLRFAEILVSKKKYERDCMAALADWHEEYFEALDQKRGKAKMAAIRIRHTWGFFKATGCLVVLEMVGKLVAKLISKISGA